MNIQLKTLVCLASSLLLSAHVFGVHPSSGDEEAGPNGGPSIPFQGRRIESFEDHVDLSQVSGREAKLDAMTEALTKQSAL